MSNSFTISVVTTVDPVLRASATMGLALDSPSLVTLTHDILDGALRRVVADSSGVVESTTLELEHACLSCAIREDVIPTLERLMASGNWADAVVALPVSAEPAPLLRSLEGALGRRGVLAGARYGATLAVVDAHTFASDAFDETSVLDLGAGLYPDDDRVIAEALAPQLAIADAIVLASDAPASADARAAADHLRGDGATVVEAPLGALDAATLLAPRGAVAHTLERANPLRPTARTPRDQAGVWTLRLESPHPFHPGRLRDNLHRLADHRVRARGVFWVPARPGAACLWDGAGRQLSVGECGTWGRRLPRTHLTITGTGDERAAIAEAFHATLARPDEVASLRGPGADALSDWFGDDEI